MRGYFLFVAPSSSSSSVRRKLSIQKWKLYNFTIRTKTRERGKMGRRGKRGNGKIGSSRSREVGKFMERMTTAPKKKSFFFFQMKKSTRYIHERDSFVRFAYTPTSHESESSFTCFTTVFLFHILAAARCKLKSKVDSIIVRSKFPLFRGYLKKNWKK